MARDPERLRLRLEALRQSFQAQLPDRIAALIEQHRRIAEGGFEDADLHDLALAAHTLKGSAATYGFTASGDAAARLEEAIEAMLGLPPAERARTPTGLVRLLGELWRTTGAADMPEDPALLDDETVATKASARTEKSIYLLEDDALLRELLSVQLGHYGYRVRAFAETPAFHAAVVAVAPDAVIIDVMMADSESAGLDILGTLRREIASPLPAVVVTVRTDLEARVAAVRAGAAAYFTKPVDVTELVAALDRLTFVETAEPYRILIVDDDAGSAGYHGEVLRFAGMETRIVTAPEAAMEQLSEFRPDLLLLDMYMPNISGPDLAAVIRQQPSFTGLPIVFLSAEQDPEKQLATIVGGADDFLTKPIHPDRLISSITARAERSRLLLSMTIQDPMTKLLNHTATKDRLRTEMIRAARAEAPLVFALLDIDHFKRVNDTYGHPVGDAVIWGLARLLRQRLRQSDAVGRYGGEEFGVIMPDTTLDEAGVLLDALRRDFSEIEFLAGRTRFTMAFSGGLVAAQRGMQPADMIRAADDALYAAKRGGRNRLWAQTPA